MKVIRVSEPTCSRVYRMARIASVPFPTPHPRKAAPTVRAESSQLWAVGRPRAIAYTVAGPSDGIARARIDEEAAVRLGALEREHGPRDAQLRAKVRRE
jgi:hypothetical protein